MHTSLKQLGVDFASCMQYYQYEIFAPYGTNGPHTLTSATTKVCAVIAGASMLTRAVYHEAH